MLKHIILSSGDVALVVNGQIIMTADPQFESTSAVEEVAEKLAAALEQPLQRIERPEPDDEEWNWDGVLEETEVGQAFGHIPAGG
jgi:hypothetical protein